MAKAWLRDDVPEESAGVTVALEGDGFGVPAFVAEDVPVGVSTPTTVEVRQREFAGYDPMGNPVFEWDVVVSAEAVVWKVSRGDGEFQSIESGTVTVLYSGSTLVTEGAVVVAGNEHWDVTQVKRPEGRLEMAIRRVVAS